MENELRFYLKGVKAAIAEGTFTPKYFITAVELPTGAIELAINTENITEKLDYILDAYDDDMHLKSNPEIKMSNMMLV